VTATVVMFGYCICHLQLSITVLTC